ncbi:MAG: citryl-CoA lyase [Anaerolineae bacterium]|nr:citryl-CoA lyase [Anaerolineae bacterium]
MNEQRWKTAITKVEPNKVLLRGYPIDQLMDQVPFPHVVYLVLKGELPSEAHGRLMDAILISSVDHGASPPSVLAARTVASTGAPLSTAIAAGILSISRYHGGAIEDCMRLMLDLVKHKHEKGVDAITVAREKVADLRAQKIRVPGYGHRIHTDDPRTNKLFALAEELGIAGEYVEMAHALRQALRESLDRDLPMNVDGAIAVMLCEMGFPPEMGNGLFAISRITGLVAHVFEEMVRERPMRYISPRAHEYDGPAERVSTGP